MNTIIDWCNSNQGFATIFLSFCTLMVSIIAIVISIKTSKYPYLKKLRLECGTFFGVEIDIVGIHVTAINIGNRKISIKNMGLLINNQIYTNIETINNSKVSLSSGDSTSQYFDNEKLHVLKKLNQNLKVYGIVEDTEGKKYKKYISKIKKIV